jgi:hypothetical protein
MISAKARLSAQSSNPLRNIKRFLAEASRLIVTDETEVIAARILIGQASTTLPVRLFLNSRYSIVALTISGVSANLRSQLIENLAPLGWISAGESNSVLYRLLKSATSVQLASQILLILNALQLESDSLVQTAVPSLWKTDLDLEGPALSSPDGM